MRLPRALACIGLLAASPAAAHPHVWVSARAAILFEAGGRVTGVRHAWTFDEAYSAFATQGLDRDGDGALTADELRDLARTNVEALEELGYFTVVKADGAPQAFARPQAYGMRFENGRLTLELTLPLAAPARAAKALVLDLFDPTYFVSFTLAEGEDAVTLADAPKGCRASVKRPKPLAASAGRDLPEAFFQSLTAASGFGASFSNRILVACP